MQSRLPEADTSYVMPPTFTNQLAMRTLSVALAVAAFAVPAAAQTAPPNAASPTPAASPAPSDSASPEFREIHRVSVPGGPAPTPTPLPLCSTATITPAASVSSKDADPGQTFPFSVTAVNDPRKLYTNVVPGASGVGVVSVVRRGRTGGEPGLLVLETRYVVASDGSHTPVSLLRSVNGLFLGRTNNSPALLGIIPYVGYVTSAYDALHKGGNTAAGPADSLIVLLGDEEVAGNCAPPPPPDKK